MQILLNFITIIAIYDSLIVMIFELGFALIWELTQCRILVCYRSFDTPYRPRPEP
jgi:hypothetical protein